MKTPKHSRDDIAGIEGDLAVGGDEVSSQPHLKNNRGANKIERAIAFFSPQALLAAFLVSEKGLFPEMEGWMEASQSITKAEFIKNLFQIRNKSAYLVCDDHRRDVACYFEK